MQPYPLDTINGKIYYRYTVEKGIGLYRIGVNFNVSQEDILELNPNIQTTGLKIGEQILIPAKGITLTQTASPEKQDTANIPPQQAIPFLSQENTIKVKELKVIPKDSNNTSPSFSSPNQDTIIIEKSTIRLALILPLHANATKRNQNIERFYDFYAGVLLAIYDAQAAGMYIELFTYDIDKTVPSISNLLNDPTFPKVDAIIGPAYAQQVDTVAKLAQKDSTFLLVPFASELEQINNNPFIIKFNPSNEKEIEAFVKYLAKKKNEINCILIEQSEGEIIPQSIQILHNALKSRQIPMTKTTIDQIMTNTLSHAFIPNKENILIFNTKNYDNLQTIMPYLEKIHNEYPFTLYTHYSWQDEKIPFSQIYTSVFKQSYQIPGNYSQRFEQYFNYSIIQKLPRYDLLGYDLTRHLLLILQTKERLNEIPAEHLQYTGIQSNIRYQRLHQGGYENQTVHIRHK
jgi:LysM repeat protein